ncbi:DAK2 domain-containing protein [Cellulomonas sp. zg-ZUI222]|uniref:DAK2 domain-containing protein n=1 Tax=Cellulomonas wangleii TaxID=2816956 RepID=A0ABX8D118_9CELL|nr:MULTISPECIES: DAK2 domain-containing protein [Cellulomonas]MBO0899916.1 DAK2 domain-containing protein [Cellulomonas sp. zg-ZUI22]MBO0921170.1 DAK2 domain-containing protein [Cellulomonas wangleii]MBO0925348.1 DAK2 domain-containing protein [Cellulomonas wangleii]QVI61159.1 DAK2 domain-containing protein [Cellulomonas wangleii]
MRVEVAARQVVLDGDAVRAWAAGALTACRAARELIDAVNVFPVPDADTGSNVTLTVAGGAAAVAADGGLDGPTELLATFAHGAARAARGNSGIILSQWLVGLSAGLADGSPTDRDGTAALVSGLERAARAARAAVPDPQEGTVLTIAREVATHARHGMRRTEGSPADVLAAATDAARADLDRLSASHDVLRAAHVVDAGACALLVVLDALVHTLRTGGRALQEADLDLTWLPRAGPDVVAGCAPASGGAYEVMMLVRATWPGVTDLAVALQGVGEAVAVVDAGASRHAHVHCDDPAAAIALVPDAAREQVVVRRVDEPTPADRGLVVLTPSPGLSAWYATCGAVTLVGPDPDVEQVARAAVDTRAGRVVVVGAGVAPVAAAPADPRFDLLATTGDGPAVVACLALVADPQVTPEAGSDALRRLRAGTPTGADEVPAVVAALLADARGAQGVTLVHGVDVDRAAVRAAADVLRAAHPQLEVVVAGPAAGAAWWVGVD